MKTYGDWFNVKLLNKNVVLFLQVFERERERGARDMMGIGADS